ncbi:MAG: adenylosuccinate lyase [Anaerolineales bacterium]|nr:adenylosuccinate lyase [Anaerolineales bacterium]
MSYQSPYSARYGSDEMRRIWSEQGKRRLWRRAWLAVAEAQAAAGLVTPEQIDDIRDHVEEIDLARASELEAEVGHDLMAELRCFAEQCPVGGGVLHWGLTSADIQDNADIVRQKAALSLLLTRLRSLLLILAERIDQNAELPVMGYTHLQPAEPTTLGYRFSTYAQDLLDHVEILARIRKQLRGKGIKGAVGTSATFVDMLADSAVTSDMLEANAMQSLGIDAFPISTQVYPRIQDYTLLAALAGLAASMHKFAFDMRLMQSFGFRAAAEPFGKAQVGSSAMPFKRNPIRAEKICSLARQAAAGLREAWDNAAVTLLERTLDDSANRRRLLPETFLALEETLISAEAILEGLVIDADSSAAAMETYGPFAAVERLLTQLVCEGADRQDMHERLRQHCMSAWIALQAGKPNPLSERLCNDTSVLRYLQPAKIQNLLDARSYVGLAPARAHAMAERIRCALSA